MEADKTSHKGTESEININRYPSVYSLPVDGPLCQFFHILFWLKTITREVNRHAPFEIHIAGNDIYIYSCSFAESSFSCWQYHPQ